MNSSSFAAFSVRTTNFVEKMWTFVNKRGETFPIRFWSKLLTVAGFYRGLSSAVTRRVVVVPRSTMTHLALRQKISL